MCVRVFEYVGVAVMVAVVIIVIIIVVAIVIVIVTVRAKPRAGRLDVSSSSALAAAYTKADHPDGKGPADLNELAGGRPLTAREVEKLLPARVTVGGVHRPLRTDAGAGLWDEVAMHFTMCNAKRALWYFDREPLPTAPPTPPAHRGGANEAGAREQGAARPGEGT